MDGLCVMPKGSRKIKVLFGGSHLTHFGGMLLIHSFCKKLRLKKLLQESIRFSQPNQTYHSSELIMALLYAIIMGMKRINKTEILQYNGFFLEILGLSRFPDQTTLRRFLKRLSPQAIRQLARLHDSLRVYLRDLPRKRTSLTFDIDSVVITIYGKQQGGRVGYNPKKPGRRSYHPLFCFESHWQEFWHGTLRPGNAASATGAIAFFKTCLDKAPQDIARSRIRFRMDSGFYGRKIVQFLDENGVGYVIVARENSIIKARARACRFRKLNNGWEVGEFFENVHQKWDARHRFVVVRRPIPADPIEAKQLTLFKDVKYVYHTFVTNLPMSPWRVYLFYNPRATIEKNNREFLYDYPLSKVPSNSWKANVAFFQLLLFAADIVHWFKRLCLPEEYLWTTLDTIRTDFLLLPAKFSRHGSQNILLLPKDFHQRKEFQQALHKIQKLRLPKNFRFCK
jgi:hypothetical protein